MKNGQKSLDTIYTTLYHQRMTMMSDSVLYVCVCVKGEIAGGVRNKLGLCLDISNLEEFSCWIQERYTDGIIAGLFATWLIEGYK